MRNGSVIDRNDLKGKEKYKQAKHIQICKLIYELHNKINESQRDKG